MDAAFWFVAISMFISGTILWWFGEETHPRLNPQRDDAPVPVKAHEPTRSG
jgi:hypothetical protein